jgi:methionyl aminopeptidase
MLKDIEQIVIDYVNKHNLIAAFKWYGGFPWYLCTSVNDCVVHGIPDRTILKPGDVLKVDAGINYRGAISDAAFSIIIGWAETNPAGQLLIDIGCWYENSPTR